MPLAPHNLSRRNRRTWKLIFDYQYDGHLSYYGSHTHAEFDAKVLASSAVRGSLKRRGRKNRKRLFMKSGMAY